MDHSEPALALFDDGPGLDSTGASDATVPAVEDLSRPLADRLRPRTLGQVVGQEHLLGDEAPIGRMVKRQHLVSMVLREDHHRPASCRCRRSGLRPAVGDLLRGC
jgi:putative ATPase